MILTDSTMNKNLKQGKEEEDEPEMKFTTKGLSEDLSILNKLLGHFKAMDQTSKDLQGLNG